MLKWNAKYELGIQSIDQQHRTWLELLNQLATTATHSNGRSDLILTTLQQVVQYGINHFEFEEALLKEHAYGDQYRHSEIHKQFLLTHQKKLEEAKNGSLPMASVLLSEMNQWLINHILVEDRAYVEHLKSRGVS